MTNYDEYPRIDSELDRERFISVAEEYLARFKAGELQDPTERKLDVRNRDLQSEIDGQVSYIDGLVDTYNERPDEEIDRHIKQAKIDFGKMLVDKGNPPPK